MLGAGDLAGFLAVADQDFEQRELLPPPRRCGGGGGASAPAEHWIEIVLIDDHGRPCCGERFVVEHSDGSVLEGTLGPTGVARIEGIAAEDCRVVFPDLDRSMWSPVAAVS